MIQMILFGVGMLLVTVIFQYFLSRSKKHTDFWTGTGVIFAMAILGILSHDVSYFAGILGYIIGDEIGKFAGWH